MPKMRNIRLDELDANLLVFDEACQDILFDDLSHQYTVNDKGYIVSYQHGRNEIVRVMKEDGKDSRGKALAVTIHLKA